MRLPRSMRRSPWRGMSGPVQQAPVNRSPFMQLLLRVYNCCNAWAPPGGAKGRAPWRDKRKSADFPGAGKGGKTVLRASCLCPVRMVLLRQAKGGAARGRAALRQASIASGFSRLSMIADRKSAPSAPSMTR